MAPGIEQRIQFTISEEGAEKVVKAFDKLKLGIGGAEKQIEKYAAQLTRQEARQQGALQKLEDTARAHIKNSAATNQSSAAMNKLNKEIQQQLNYNRVLAASEKQKTTDLKASLDQQVSNMEQMEMARKRSEAGWKGFFTRFQPGFLSMMFGGMQLQRVMGNLIRGMITNFKELSAETDPTRIALTRLEGSLKFLKFQIVSAAGPLIQKFADWLANMATAIAKSDPEKLKAIAIGIGALWVLGFALFNVGQFMTFVTGIGTLISSMSAANAGTAAANVANMGGGMSKLAGGFGKLAPTLSNLKGIIGPGLAFSIGFNFVGNAFEHIANGDFGKAGIDLTKALGSVLMAFKKTRGAGTVMGAISVGLDIVDNIKDKSPSGIGKAVADGLMMAGIRTAFFNQALGAVMIGMGFVLEKAVTPLSEKEVEQLQEMVVQAGYQGTLEINNPVVLGPEAQASLDKVYDDHLRSLGIETDYSKVVYNPKAQEAELERLKFVTSSDFIERYDTFNQKMEDNGEALEKINTNETTMINNTDPIITGHNERRDAADKEAEAKIKLAIANAAVNATEEGETNISEYVSQVNITLT